MHVLNRQPEAPVHISDRPGRGSSPCDGHPVLGAGVSWTSHGHRHHDRPGSVLTYLRDGGAGGGDGVADPEAGGVVGHVGDAAVALLRPAATWGGKYKTRVSWHVARGTRGTHRMQLS